MARISLVIVIAVAAAVLGLAMPDLLDWNNDARSEAATESFSCTTGIGQTSCTLTLADPHLFPSTSGMTVSETSPASVDRTASSSVNSAQTGVTVSGLTASTSYGFTVVYLALGAEVSTGLNRFYNLMPQFIGALVFGLVAAVLTAAIVTAVSSLRRHNA